MSISRHVVVPGVNNRLTIALNMEHTSTEHMSRIVGSDLDIAKLYGLMQLDGLNFVNAILNHIWCETIDLAFLSHRDLSEIFQHERNDGLGGRSGDYGPRVPNSFTEVGQGTTVIQMEVCNETSINHIGQVKLFG